MGSFGQRLRCQLALKYWLPSLVDHHPLLRSHWFPLDLAWLRGSWFPGLKDTHVGVELLILLLELLLDSLLVESYLLLVWSFRRCCCSCPVFKIVNFSICGIHVCEFSRNWRLGCFGSRNSYCRHTLNYLLILVRIDCNFWIVDDLFLLSFGVFEWARPIPGLGPLSWSGGTSSLLWLIGSNQVLISGELKTLIASIWSCGHVPCVWAEDSAIGLGLISWLVNLDSLIRCSSLHQVLLVDLFIRAGRILNHLRTVVHLLLPFNHVLTNHSVIANYFLRLLHLKDLRLSCVGRAIAWHSRVCALIVLFWVWGVQSVCLRRCSWLVTHWQTVSRLGICDCGHRLARLLHNRTMQMARGLTRGRLLLVYLHKRGTCIGLRLRCLHPCVKCWSYKNTVASINGNICLRPGNFFLLFFFLICRKIWSIHHAIFKIHK